MTKVKADGCRNVMKFCPLYDTYEGQPTGKSHYCPLGPGLSSRGAAFSPTDLQHHLAQGTWPFYTFSQLLGILEQPRDEHSSNFHCPDRNSEQRREK